MGTPKVSVVIVSFNTRALLRTCLASVPSRADTEIIVVDNASADGSADMVAEEFPAVDLVRAPSNLGFAAANNVAIGRARGRVFVLLNPDAVVNPDTIDTLTRYMDAHPGVGISGPTLVFPDGSFQSSGFAFPTVTSELRQSRRVNWVLERLGSKAWSRPPGDDPIEVDWVDGACLAIRREVTTEVGLLDERYFLYGEEVDWCYRAKRAGWRVVAVRGTKAVHHRGQSTGGASSATVGYLTETRLRFFHTHMGLATALFVSTVFAAGCLKQLAEDWLRHTVRRQPKSSEAAARLHAVWRWWTRLAVSAA